MSISSALSLILKNLSHDITAIFEAFRLAHYRNSEITVDGLSVVVEVVHDWGFITLVARRVSSDAQMSERGLLVEKEGNKMNST